MMTKVNYESDDEDYIAENEISAAEDGTYLDPLDEDSYRERSLPPSSPACE